MQMPSHLPVFDFSSSYDPNRPLISDFGVGRYNELRPTMYAAEIFKSSNFEPRNIHMGIDLAAPAGTEVFSSYQGRVFCQAVNSAPGDYGGTLILEHDLEGLKIWVLYGHLSPKSIANLKQGQIVLAGELIGKIGTKQENGGWNPHLHFQICLKQPACCDAPGVVSKSDHSAALQIYPDPRLILGEIY